MTKIMMTLLDWFLRGLIVLAGLVVVLTVIGAPVGG